MTKRSLRIGIVYPSLFGGGVSTIIRHQIARFIERGHQVIFFQLGRDDEANKLDPRAQYRSLEAKPAAGPLKALGWLGRLWSLRRSLLRDRPDIVITHSIRIGSRIVFAMLGSGCPVIVTEHANPVYAASSLTPRQRLTFRYFLPKCAAFVSVSKGIDTEMAWLPEEKRHVIYNFSPKSDQLAIYAKTEREKTIVGLGRLSREKGFDRLVAAFALVAMNHPDWQLHIHGEGSERAAIEEQITKLGLGERCRLCPWTDAPLAKLSEAGIFALPSRWEGFGMALIEAMALGTACIAFDCPYGPREIIRDGENGFLVPNDDINALAAAIDRLIRSPELRAKLGKQAEAVVQRFDEEHHIQAWLNLVELLDNQALQS